MRPWTRAVGSVTSPGREEGDKRGRELRRPPSVERTRRRQKEAILVALSEGHQQVGPLAHHLPRTLQEKQTAVQEGTPITGRWHQVIEKSHI